MKNNFESKRILLTGASGWFGQSFISQYVNNYGLESLKNVILATSDGRTITHPIVPFELATITFDKACSLNDLDMIVQAGFLTKDKIEIMGLKLYNSGCSEIIFCLKKIIFNNSKATVIIISSGAVYNDTSSYGYYKKLEEQTAIKSAKKNVFVFRVFAATTRYMDYRPWSAICTFIKHKIALQDIQINSNREIMRGVVCMEDLSNIILSLPRNTDESSRNFEIYDAVSDVMSIREMAETISNTKINVIVPDYYNKHSKDFSYVGDMQNFHKLASKMNIALKDCSTQLQNAERTFYLKSFKDNEI
tara:strand:+ start:4634 stop:5548 length:915 start_codon:yes stop_codon:yes gene_type:complete